MVPNVKLHVLTIHLEPPKRGEPLYKGAMSQSVRFHCNAVTTVNVEKFTMYKFLLCSR